AFRTCLHGGMQQERRLIISGSVFSREEYPISIVLCQPAFDFGSVMMKYAQNRKWTGSRSCNDASFSWRLRSNFYRRTAWTHPAAARFSLDLFVNKQLRPEFCLIGYEFSSLLADARRILGLAREPAAEPVVGFQITDLPLPVPAETDISFAIMKVPSVACAYYKLKVRFKPFKSFNSSDRVGSGAPLSFPFPIEGKGIKQDPAICSHFHSV